MLRLRIAKKLPWVDSKGEVRSPLEEFQLLDAGARVALGTLEADRWTVWELGVVTDDWDSPDFSKPITIGNEDGVGIEQTCFALGSEQAADLGEELRPLWRAFFEYLLPNPLVATLIISDEVWHEKGQWVEIGPALVDGLLGEVNVSLASTRTPGRYRVLPSADAVNQLIAVWWPSPVGILAGSVVATVDSLAGVAENEGTITSADLWKLKHHFQTAPTFDNAGFSVLSLNEAWLEIEATMSARGWVDGRPLATMLPDV